jgi:hypothetical protein
VPDVTRRRLVPFTLTAAALLFFSLALFLPRALPQMASTGASDQPLRPLPPGMKAPVIDFRDLALEAGLTATSISGDVDQK